MRRVRYGVAMSLDGYIAGPDGQYDWIMIDPEIDFAATALEFDTYLIGRKTFETMQKMGGGTGDTPGVRSVVISRTLSPEAHPGVLIEADAAQFVRELRATPGKDIALFGGGDLFRSLLAEGLVDTVEVSVIPVLLGGGVPLLPPPAGRTSLKLTKSRVYEQTGTVGLEYEVVRSD